MDQQVIIFKTTFLYINAIYRKSGNFHVLNIHVLNIHIDLYSWVYGTHENILT